MTLYSHGHHGDRRKELSSSSNSSTFSCSPFSLSLSRVQGATDISPLSLALACGSCPARATTGGGVGSKTPVVVVTPFGHLEVEEEEAEGGKLWRKEANFATRGHGKRPAGPSPLCAPQGVRRRRTHHSGPPKVSPEIPSAAAAYPPMIAMVRVCWGMCIRWAPLPATHTKALSLSKAPSPVPANEIRPISCVPLLSCSWTFPPFRKRG